MVIGLELFNLSIDIKSNNLLNLPLEAHFHSQLFERFRQEICNDQDPHLKNMNTLQQSRQKVIIVMVLLNDGLFLFKNIQTYLGKIEVDKDTIEIKHILNLMIAIA